MPYSQGRGRFARIRRQSISKLCAVWFIVLIVLPFTAPFPTFQLEKASHSDIYDTPSKALKDTGNAAKVGVAGAWSLSAVLPVAAAFPPDTDARNPIDQPALRQTVLRI